jgi:hypothetical protein
MPAKVADAEEKELYLKPGKIYTQKDIEANGSDRPQKFKGVMASHDLAKGRRQPRPVTRTKANLKLTCHQRQALRVCCPPCVDEFVKMPASGRRRSRNRWTTSSGRDIRG